MEASADRAGAGSGSAVLSMVLPEVPCPQCGALSQPPHQVDTFVCASCGSTLHSAGGVRVYRLVQRPRVTAAAAEQAMRAWFAGPDLPRGAETTARVEVGALTSFPFLRARSPKSDSVSALANLPLADVAQLERVPGDLVPAEDDILADLCRTAIDEEVLKEEVRRAVIDPGVRELFLEERVFYPVRYSYQGTRFSAVVEAGSGRVLARRRPARRDIVGEWGIAMGTGVVLFGEALVLPGLPLKIGTVILSCAGLYPLLRWVVATHG